MVLSTAHLGRLLGVALRVELEGLLLVFAPICTLPVHQLSKADTSARKAFAFTQIAGFVLIPLHHDTLIVCFKRALPLPKPFRVTPPCRFKTLGT